MINEAFTKNVRQETVGRRLEYSLAHKRTWLLSFYDQESFHCTWHKPISTGSLPATVKGC